MKRILAMTAALLLMVSLLGPVALADRGGRGRAPGVVPPVSIPGVGPRQDSQQDRAQTQEQTQEQDSEEDAQEPAEDGEDEGTESTGIGPQRGADAARRATERFQNRGDASGPEDTDDEDEVDDDDDIDGEVEEIEDDEDIDDEASGDEDGRPGVPPGLIVARKMQERLTNGAGSPDGEEEPSGGASRFTVRLRPSDEQDTDTEGDAEVEDDEGDGPSGLGGHFWALQRVLQKHPLPFMMVGQPVTDEDGNLTGVDLLRGNRLARNYASTDTAIEIGDDTQVSLITSGGVQFCQSTAQECLAEWLADNPDACMQVFGRVELDEEGNAVFVTYRIIVRAPGVDDDGDDVVEPTPTATLPTPTATLPTPTATVPTPTATLPTPTATVPTPTATLPTPTATAAG